MVKMSLRLQVSRLAGFGGRRGLGRMAASLALALGLTACGPGHGTDCLKSTGTIVTHRREVVAGLVTISAYDNVDVRLVQDTQTYAEVRAGENLIDDITLTRNGDALEIANSSRCNWTRSYDSPREVTLHLPRIDNLFLRGLGNVSTVGPFVQDQAFCHLVGSGDFDLNFQANYLNIDQYELGDFTLRGSANNLNFTVGGSGRLFAQGLALKSCFFNTTRDSDGDAHVRATDVVAGTVAGNGTVYYGGPPAVTDIKVTGKGGKKAE